MDIKTFYQTIEGDYEEILGRFMTEARIIKFVRRFPADGSFALLKSSLASGNCEEAFRAAHTLKGVAQNLSFTKLFTVGETVTNILRGGSMAVDAYMPALEEAYNQTVAAVAQIED